ncbi:Kinesin-like protein KIN-12D [Vitis vinifera]|uniref:Kinesin-like protein KIN-12D n=1 Tax=Vitis vinifera TaxID=29760 RepID=A0A438CMS3_VITVI|nr:Kinesin-like protein KIN-12D [Vitis vinifera]
MKDAEVSKINLLEEENKLLKTEVMKLKTEYCNVLQNLEEKKSELKEVKCLECFAQKLVSENLSLQTGLSRKNNVLKGLFFDPSLLQESASNSKDQIDEIEELAASLESLEQELARLGSRPGEFIVTSLDSPSWIRVGGRLTRASDQSDQKSDQGDMDSRIVTVDQFAAAMASIQEAIASLSQRINGQQAQQTEVAPPPAIVPIPISEDPHARMDKLEQKLRQMRTSEGAITWEDFDGAPVASLPAKFRMPEIERYTGIGCPRIHLRLDSTVMRAHGLDDAQMVMFFPMSLSGAAQCWFASLEVSRRRTWDDLAQEFLRQFAFNTVIDVSRRELEALRQRPKESVTSFISRWRRRFHRL